jgi:spore coat polysaccharide biosynthesis protein SpsF (cytidylyltransferase family)
MQSSRIPNKVLQPICGRPILDWIADRLFKCKKVDSVVLAIPAGPDQEELIAWAAGRGMKVVRGSPEDVLDRIHYASQVLGATKIIRITGDLPFLDYQGVDRLVECLVPEIDYANNVYGDSPWLDGTNAEIAWSDVVWRANRITPFEKAIQSHPRITVNGETWRSHGFHWLANSHFFIRKFLKSEHDISDIVHLTLMVDDPKDLQIAEILMRRVIESGDDSYANLLRIVRSEKSTIEAIKSEG